MNLSHDRTEVKMVFFLLVSVLSAWFCCSWLNKSYFDHEVFFSFSYNSSFRVQLSFLWVLWFCSGFQKHTEAGQITHCGPWVQECE